MVIAETLLNELSHRIFTVSIWSGWLAFLNHLHLVLKGLQGSMEPTNPFQIIFTIPWNGYTLYMWLKSQFQFKFQARFYHWNSLSGSFHDSNLVGVDFISELHCRRDWRRTKKKPREFSGVLFFFIQLNLLTSQRLYCSNGVSLHLNLRLKIE